MLSLFINSYSIIQTRVFLLLQSIWGFSPWIFCEYLKLYSYRFSCFLRKKLYNYIIIYVYINQYWYGPNFELSFQLPSLFFHLHCQVNQPFGLQFQDICFSNCKQCNLVELTLMENLVIYPTVKTHTYTYKIS